jgi:periplasmic protein TonB
MLEQQETKNKRIALASSIAVHIVLFLLFLFAIAWRAPDPPLPEYGIELNFGTDDQGGGPVQPETPAGAKQPAQDDATQIKSEEVQEEDKPEAEDVKPQETKPVEQPVVSKVETPVTVKEPKKVDPKPVDKKEPPKEPVKTETKPKETVTEQKSASTTTADKTTTTSKEGKPVSHGDDPGKTGDKGDPKGKIDVDALYGKQGGGSSGFSYQLDGWLLEAEPRPNDKSSETGILRFEIEVDDQGEVRRVRTLERGVSPVVEKIYKDELYKLEFTRKSSAGNPPPISKGIVTFRLTAQ